MEMQSERKGITLIALVITIIILLILAGITINALSGENGLIAKVKQSKKTQVKSEMKEILILAIKELQVEKEGKATLEDVTQEWADKALDGYNPQITNDATINGKKVTMKKDNVTGKYIIDENLNITELEENSSNIEYWHTITNNLGEGVGIDNKAIKAAYNKPYQATITTTGNEYILETLTVTMGGQVVTTEGNNVVDVATGKIYIEKVTGDIEITATAKKLQIQYTAIAIGTSSSASNTSSIEDNSQTRGTTLYINIIANLEGIACTVTLKDDNTKSVPYAITSNGKYTFVVTGTYNGKAISEEKEVYSNKYIIQGGFVQYNAGDWTESEIKDLQAAGLYNLNASKTASTAAGLDFTFGGFTYKGDTKNSSYINNGTIITSRNQSVSSFYKGIESTPKYDGWKILESHPENDKTYVTKLVHAGSPENFVYYYKKANDAFRAEYILSSGLRKTDYNTFGGGASINPRSWDMYKDKNQLNLIEEVHCMTRGEAVAIISKTGLRDTGSYYWLGSADNSSNLDNVNDNGFIVSDSRYCWGVRPVISLKSGVYIESGEGTKEAPYVLGIE